MGEKSTRTKKSRMGVISVKMGVNLTKSREAKDFVSLIDSVNRVKYDVANGVVFEFANGDKGFAVPRAVRQRSTTMAFARYDPSRRMASNLFEVSPKQVKSRFPYQIDTLNEPPVPFFPKNEEKDPKDTTGPRLNGETFRQCFDRNWDHFADDDFAAEVMQITSGPLVAVACTLVCL